MRARRRPAPQPAEFVDAPKVHEEGQKRTFLTPLEFAASLEASRNAGSVEYAAAALMGLSGLRVADMCSLRVESLSQDDGYDSQDDGQTRPVVVVDRPRTHADLSCRATVMHPRIRLCDPADGASGTPVTAVLPR